MTTLRTETERLLVRLNRELGIKQIGIENFSDYNLLYFINMNLIELNCIPMTDEYLHKELTTIKPSVRPKGEYSNKQWNEL